MILTNTIVILAAILAPTILASAPTDSGPRTTQDLPSSTLTCDKAKITSYLQPPRPTGELSSVINEFAQSVWSAECPSGNNCGPHPGNWCWLSSEVPGTLSSDLSEWGSTASAWWSDNRVDATESSDNCWDDWKDIINPLEDAQIWFQLTTGWQMCLDWFEDPKWSSFYSVPAGFPTTTTTEAQSDQTGSPTDSETGASTDNETSTSTDDEDSGAYPRGLSISYICMIGATTITIALFWTL